MNYKSVLSDLFVDEFKQIEHKREIEEMNALYVAMTRAKTNMGIFWLYKEKDLAEKKNIKCLITKYAKEISESNQEEYVNSEFVSVSETISTSQPATSTLHNDYYDLPNKHLKLKEVRDINFEVLDLKDLFVNKKSRLIGSATHAYLSFVKYDLPHEHNIAYMQTTRQYGNIMTKAEIDEIANKAKSFIRQNQGAFDKKWDKVFNELPIFDKDKKLYRIDRLMINSRDKEILIIDYKTGQIDDSWQIEKYVSLISELPVFKRDMYKVAGEYWQMTRDYHE